MNNRLVAARYNVFIAIVRVLVALFFSSELPSPVDAQVRIQFPSSQPTYHQDSVDCIQTEVWNELQKFGGTSSGNCIDIQRQELPLGKQASIIVETKTLCDTCPGYRNRNACDQSMPAKLYEFQSPVKSPVRGLTKNDISRGSPIEVTPFPSNDGWHADMGRLHLPTVRPGVGQRLLNDQLHFYSPDSLLVLGSGFLVGGLVANTKLDQQMYDSFQDRVSSANRTRHFLHSWKNLGNGYYVVPVFAALWGIGTLFPEMERLQITGRWGERTIRGLAVGAIPTLFLQNATGASRPTEGIQSSAWHPFQDNNGVSGHAFVSSMPFITAAKMTNEPWKKSLWYVGSVIGPLSRINDGSHYPSQAFLGWWVSYVAASSVQQSEFFESRWQIAPYVANDGYGAIGTYRW
ncbi:MAG: phosphatase PAP2 family protein [Pirellula sp.]|nr:phosphatase PAP2 family protein [Pirellula sp.]